MQYPNGNPEVKEAFRKRVEGLNIPRKGWRKLYLLLIILLALYYYFALPPIHYASMEFWFFLFLATGGVLIIEALVDISSKVKGVERTNVGRKYKLFFSFWGIVLAVGAIAYLVLSPVFMADRYASMIEVEERSFEEDFPETDLSQIPLVDRDTAERLGNRHLGALTNLVSQFEAAEDYTQITIEGKPYRVSPLEYAGFFRWLNNFREGIPHYIKVDNVTGEVTIETPEQPMKYSYADLFNRNVMRRLRLNHPFTLFRSPTFEVDDSGHPYYVATTYRRNFFIREPEVSGVITLDAVTGETTLYELGQVPSWIDRVYSADLILHQLKMRGHYSGGFWNSLFAQQGVTEPTDGYNYLPIGDDLYLYTGITSVVSDDSNIGFVLVNMRTKEAVMYPLTAAEEYSAMRSAEGSVQETSYEATFPLLINIKGKPLYILTLKDNSGLIKEYALVDAQNYQRVYTAPSVEKLLQLYAEENPVDLEALPTLDELESKVGKVEAVEAVVVEGNTVYYFLVDGQIYQAPITLNEALPFVEEGTEIEFRASEDGQMQSIVIDGEAQ